MVDNSSSTSKLFTSMNREERTGPTPSCLLLLLPFAAQTSTFPVGEMPEACPPHTLAGTQLILCFITLFFHLKSTLDPNENPLHPKLLKSLSPVSVLESTHMDDKVFMLAAATPASLLDSSFAVEHLRCGLQQTRTTSETRSSPCTSWGFLSAYAYRHGLRARKVIKITKNYEHSQNHWSGIVDHIVAVPGDATRPRWLMSTKSHPPSSRQGFLNKLNI